MSHLAENVLKGIYPIRLLY